MTASVTAKGTFFREYNFFDTEYKKDLASQQYHMQRKIMQRFGMCTIATRDILLAKLHVVGMLHPLIHAGLTL